MTTRRNQGCCRQVIPGNSARLFHNPAPVLSHAAVQEILRSHKAARIIEIGGGCLRNALYLQNLGFRVCVLELERSQHKFQSAYADFRSRGGKVLKKTPRSGKFDIAIATFVIETICDRRQRAALVSAVNKLLKPTGCLVVSVRGPADLLTAKNAGIACSDGYLTPNRTFARSYSRRQLEDFLRACGFKKLQFLHKPDTQTPKLLHVIARKG